MTDELLLLSGNDIPFPTGRITIHQPRLKEIAYINESRFWPGCELLKFNKEILPDQDKVNLSNTSNFNIIMTMVQEKNVQSYTARINLLSVLALLFPTNEILLSRDAIHFKDHQTNETGEITENNFQAFKEILIDMFCLNGENKQYDPSGDLAAKIANQIKKGRQKKAKLASQQKQTKIAILSRYASILAVGQQKDLNSLMNYTVYQLMDEFNRFNLKMKYDSWLQIKCAGTSDLKDPEDWFKDIHDKNNTQVNNE